jgi:hypothetical protein
MHTYNIMIDEMEPDTYQIALSPSVRQAGAMATKRYPTQDSLIVDLRRYLRYNDVAIERFFALSEKREALVNFALSEEDAAALGWLAKYNRF